jgi:hypothetical protein
VDWEPIADALYEEELERQARQRIAEQEEEADASASAFSEEARLLGEDLSDGDDFGQGLGY